MLASATVHTLCWQGHRAGLISASWPYTLSTPVPPPRTPTPRCPTCVPTSRQGRLCIPAAPRIRAHPCSMHALAVPDHFLPTSLCHTLYSYAPMSYHQAYPAPHTQHVWMTHMFARFPVRPAHTTLLPGLRWLTCMCLTPARARALAIVMPFIFRPLQQPLVAAPNSPRHAEHTPHPLRSTPPPSNVPALAQDPRRRTHCTIP